MFYYPNAPNRHLEYINGEWVDAKPEELKCECGSGSNLKSILHSYWCKCYDKD